jgi:hypothetical protein
MKSAFLALMILLVVSPLALAQSGDSETKPFIITSLNTAYGVQGVFEGEYRVFANRIQINLKRAEIRISENCPYKGRRLVSSVKFGLAVNAEDNRWKIARASGNEYRPKRIMLPGDTYDLGTLYFEIPLDDTVDLTRHWLVVQMENNSLDALEEQEGYAFAHTSRDIFVPKKP